MLKYKIGDRVICRFHPHYGLGSYGDECTLTVIASKKDGVTSLYYEYMLLPDVPALMKLHTSVFKLPLDNHNGDVNKYINKPIIGCNEKYIIRFATKQKCALCLNIK